MILNDVVKVVKGTHKNKVGVVVGFKGEGMTLKELNEYKVYRIPNLNEVVIHTVDDKIILAHKKNVAVRKAICTDHNPGWDNTPTKSHTKLFLLRIRPEQEYDSYYCGCYGWD